VRSRERQLSCTPGPCWYSRGDAHRHARPPHHGTCRRAPAGRGGRDRLQRVPTGARGAHPRGPGRDGAFLAERVSAEVAASLHAASLAASAMEFAQLSAAERLGALRLVFRQIEGAVVVALLSLQGAQIAARCTSLPARRNRRWRIGRWYTRRTSENSPAAFRFARRPDRGRGRAGSCLPRGSPRVAVAVRARAISCSGRGQPRAACASGRGIRASALAVTRDRGPQRTDRAGPEPRGSGGTLFSGASPLVQAALAGNWGRSPSPDPIASERLGQRPKCPTWAGCRGDEPAEDALAGRACWRGAPRRRWPSRSRGSRAGAAGQRRGRSPHPRPASRRGGPDRRRAGPSRRRCRSQRRARRSGTAFNAMATEIERWNRELAQRVEEKTREAREAQDLLLRAQSSPQWANSAPESRTR